tara:strand:+ start:735 stop:908 length:174 start_codon:yes stop_codon:yes gene_type:complete
MPYRVLPNEKILELASIEMPDIVPIGIRHNGPNTEIFYKEEVKPKAKPKSKSNSEDE